MTIRDDAHRPEFHRAAPPQLPVRCATTANITIATALNNGDTLDGLTLATGDRVLVKDQTAGATNGIYIVGVTPARSFDMGEGVAAWGAIIYVIAGTTNGGTLWRNTNATLPTIDTTALTWSLLTTSSGGSALAWFNVKTYGAVNDATTNDRAAINAAIAALNAAGRGVLYFPAGAGYLVSGGALTTITADGVVIGDGMGAYDGSAYVSAILFNSQTAICFTHTGKTLLFRDLGIFNTYSGTPSAGAGIQVSGAFIGQKVDLESIVVSGFYINVDRQVGSQWTNSNVWNVGPVLYGEKIQNTVNQDAGDWAILGCNYFAKAHAATAAIYQIGAGGGKIAGTKINILAGGGYVTGISLPWPAAIDSSILAISACSIENVSGDAILITTSATGSFGLLTIAGLEVGLYSNNTGRAVKITASNAGGAGTAGAFYGAVIDGLMARTDGTARAAVELTKTDRVTLGDFSLVGFNARYTSSGDTNTTDASGGSGTVTSVALTMPAGFTVTGSPITTSGTLAVTGGTPTDHEHINAVTFSGDGSTTAFELPAAPFDAYAVTAFVAGVRQDVTLSGTLLTTMTFGSAPASGTDNIAVDIVAAAA